MALELDLDFDKLDETYFDDIADILLNKCTLLINGKKHRLCEIEFYLNNKNHKDEYVHCNFDQKYNHCYYFHKTTNGPYRGGTFKGMDLAFGCISTNTYFGILVRSVMSADEETFICGPCNCVDYILKCYSVDSLRTFTQNQIMPTYKNARNFTLNCEDDIFDDEIYKGPRIGLREGKEHHKSLYRYCIFKSKIKKDKTSLQKLT